MQKSGHLGRRKVRGAFEATLGLGGIVGASWWIPAAWRPSHLLFCAFFLVVFAITVRYQIVVAYGASLLAACSYGLLLWERPEMRVQPGILPLTLEPFLLLVCGLLTSDLLRWQRQRFNALEQKYMQADQALQSSQENYQLERKAREELEHRAGGQMTTMTALSDNVLTLWAQEGLERYRALLNLVIQGIEAQTCACYLQQDGVFHLALARPDEGSENTGLLDLDDPVLKQVIVRHEVITVHDVLATEGQLPSNVALMAGPLLNRDKEILGVVVVKHMSLLHFTPGAVRLFRILLQMASTALQNTQENVLERHQALQKIPATTPLAETTPPGNSFPVTFQ